MNVTRDERYIVFHSNRSGSFQIWRANSDGTNLKQLTIDGSNSSRSLSPDGQSVVHNCRRSDISTVCRIPIDGGDAVQLAPGRGSRPALSPDGKYIAFFEPANSASVRLAVMLSSGGLRIHTFAVCTTMVGSQ